MPLLLRQGENIKMRDITETIHKFTKKNISSIFGVRKIEVYPKCCTLGPPELIFKEEIKVTNIFLNATSFRKNNQHMVEENALTSR